jgi:hypothetical protein
MEGFNTMTTKKQDQNKLTVATENSAKSQGKKGTAAHKGDMNQNQNDKFTAQSEKNSSAKDDSETSQKLESLLEFLQGDLSSTEPDAALKMVNEWYTFVHQSKQPELKEIASGLKELQKLLKHDEVTGHDLGELLIHLGEQTSDVASEAEKELKTPLQRAGKQVTKVGQSLAKEEDRQHLEALDSLTDVLGQDAGSIDLESASGGIDRWYELLHKSEDENLKEIADELKKLKQILKSNKVKPAELSEKLIHLGELTTESASNAGRGFKGAVQKLGKMLTKFGKSME